jgi:SAM-dependent methyltransferase
MSTWTAGYVADIGYTYGYYRELNPLRIKLAFLNAGLVYPECGTACELGFGQGMSANIHAAATVTQWYGTDFNPSQAAFARELADVSGADAHLFDEAFEAFAARTDLPDFDFIALHGIWSWISDANRKIIVDFLLRKLKVGGVLYISYNTLPGWAAFAPMRHLMVEHSQVNGAEGRGIVSRIDDAIDFADKLLSTNPMFSRANPLVGDRIKKLKDQNRHYLAHEYFNRDWHPMHFSTMAEWLEPAKVSYACSAHALDHIDSINLTSEQQVFLKQFADPHFKESVRDFMVNQQFRRDYWVKGPRRLTVLQQAEILKQQRVVLVSHRADVGLKVTGSLGEADMSEELYGPVLDLLSDHKVRSLDEIFQAVRSETYDFAKLVQVIMVLSGGGHVVAAQDANTAAKARKTTDRLNQHLLNRTRSSEEVNIVASPVLGGGVAANRFQQLFMLAILQGHKKPADWARLVWELISSQNQKLVKEGKPLETPEENIAELTLKAEEFALKQLPIMKALMVI